MASFSRSAIGAKGSDGEMQPKLEVKAHHKAPRGKHAMRTSHNSAVASKAHSPKGHR